MTAGLSPVHSTVLTLTDLLSPYSKAHVGGVIRHLKPYASPQSPQAQHLLHFATHIPFESPPHTPKVSAHGCEEKLGGDYTPPRRAV